eukprot:3431241-Pyramimonas_sp.AAC.3
MSAARSSICEPERNACCYGACLGSALQQALATASKLAAENAALKRAQKVGLHMAIKRLLSHLTTGKFNSPVNFHGRRMFVSSPRDG